ncbi:MAG: hypothetical protein ACRDFB_04525, partial [Rhabdochlamydiaceae bacterium]
MDEPLFVPAPFFILRTSIFKEKIGEDLLKKIDGSKDLIQLFVTNELLREAILIASPSLYSALQRSHSSTDAQSMHDSLLNYV